MEFSGSGRRVCGFPRIFELLKKEGNNCPFSVEIEFTQAGPKDLAEINRAVKTSAEYLKKAGFDL